MCPPTSPRGRRSSLPSRTLARSAVWNATLAVTVTITSSTGGLAQNTGEQIPTPKPTDRFEVPRGCEVALFAESPHLYNPTAIDIDHRGRVWVTEAVNYRKWTGRNKGRVHAPGDRVVILEDTDGDGKCDSSKVFVQEKDLVAPLGICVIGDKILVSCSPHAILYTDADGDDVPDRREVFLTGFGGLDHDHGLHSFVAGPDGYLYFNAGNAGPHVVKDKAGWNLRSGSIYRGGGPSRVRNKPGLLSDDGRAWTGGIVMRVRPDGTGLRVLAHNFRNPYEVAVDAFGNMFQSDNDDDGNRGCRTSYVMEGGNYGYFSADGTRSWRADKRPDQSTWTAHWHQDDPGVLPAGASNGGGGPTGVAVYEGPPMPGCPKGTVLNCDAGAGVVYGHVPRRAGGGFVLDKTTFVQVAKGTGGHRAKWFRPSDVAVGPDGSIYVADWFDPGVGGHAAGDRAAYGRILRIRGAATKPARVDLDSIAGRAEALHSPSANVRGLALHRLRNRTAGEVAAVRATWRDSKDNRRRARALYYLSHIPEILGQGLEDPDPEIRVAAIRAARLRLQPADALEKLRGLTADASAAVRSEVALALAGVDFAECADQLLELAQRIPPEDRFSVEAFGTATHGRESAVYTYLLAEIGDQPLKWTDRFAAIAWRLHPIESVPAHLERALASVLPKPARIRAIDAIAFVGEKAAAEAMSRIAASGPEDTRALAAFWLQSRATNDWSGHGIERFVSDRKDAKLLWRSGVMRRGAKRFDVEVPADQTLWLVVSEGGDGYSYDWADWIAPEFVTTQGPIPLTKTKWTNAKAGWGQVRIDKNANGGKLSLNGRRPLSGIGTHAPSEITFQTPKDARRLRGRVGPDFGGTSQGGGTSIEFLIYAKTAEPDRLGPWRNQLLGLDGADGKAGDATRIALAKRIAIDKDGGRLLIALLEQGKLSKELKEAVSQTIFKNPDQSVRLLATKHFAVPGTETFNLPPIEKIAALAGDPKKGGAHFRTICAACHVFQGKGKDIGPNLTEIRRKYGTAALLESILNPDAAISFGYENWIVETKKGELLMGFILAEGENVVLKDQEGKRHVIRATDIESKERSPTSLMPAALVAALRAQDLADLAAFLLTDPSRGR